MQAAAPRRAVAARMRKGIHPELKNSKIIVNGEQVGETRGVLEEYHVDVWAGNHPFYQGHKGNMVMDEGQVRCTTAHHPWTRRAQCCCSTASCFKMAVRLKAIAPMPPAAPSTVRAAGRRFCRALYRRVLAALRCVGTAGLAAPVWRWACMPGRWATLHARERGSCCSRLRCTRPQCSRARSTPRTSHRHRQLYHQHSVPLPTVHHRGVGRQPSARAS